jgi:nucleotide-binding universal stress UspA family protein
MYSRILVPVDDSSCSLKGLTEALKLAKALNARIRLMHVCDELVTESALVASAYRHQLVESMREAGQAILSDAQAMAQQLGAAVEVVLVESTGRRASDCIVATAQQWSADLIVMGTHGRRGMSRLAIGSDAELVVRSTSIPVLMVRERQSATSY